MKNKVIVALTAIAAILTGCSAPLISKGEIEAIKEVVESASEASVPDESEVAKESEEAEDSNNSNSDYPTGVLGIAPTKTFEEVYMPIAAIVDSYEEDHCLHYLNEVEDMLDSLGYCYTYEDEATNEYDIWIVVEDPDADAEIRIYGYYDEFANVEVSEEDIRYDLTCVEYRCGQYYGITDTPNLYNEPCKHGVDDKHEVSDDCEYKNISWEENAITNVDSTEDVRRFFFVTEE